jgi:tetratricopeptide (TPR) repeat protein
VKRALVLYIVSLVLIAAEAGAQIGRVAGTITDDAGRPVKGATITAENRDQSPSTLTSSSDGKGRYSLLGMRRGIWIFTIQAPGFQSASHRVEIVTTRQNPPLDVQLVKGSTPALLGPLAGIDMKEVQRRIEAAEALDKAGDYAGALAAYRDLLARVPALTSIHLRMGAIHERAGDTAAAVAAYKRFLELEPTNGRAQSALERLKSRMKEEEGRKK